MAGSSSAGFPWTYRSTHEALTAVLKLKSQQHADPFNENIIVQATSELRATPWSSAQTAALQYVTTNDLMALLNECRLKYQRICDLADNPNTLGFSRRSNQIVMLPDQYARHIQVCPFFQHFLCILLTF